MAFDGNIEDIPIADVVHLLRVSRATGTLHVKGQTGEGSLAFRDGDMVYAIHPDRAKNLGRLLVEMRAIGEEELAAGLERQRIEGAGRKPLMATLIELGMLGRESGHRGLERLLQLVLLELVGWRRGAFWFEADQLMADDGFRHVPVDMALQGVDTDRLLKEAVRAFQERGRAPLAAPQASSATGEPPLSVVEPGQELEARVDLLLERDAAAAEVTELPDLSEPQREGLGPSCRAVVLCEDGIVKHSFKRLAFDRGISAFISHEERDAEEEVRRSCDAGQTPVLVVDLSPSREGRGRPGRRLALCRRIMQRHPDLPLVVLHDPTSEPSVQLVAFELGARAVLGKPVERGDHGVYVSLVKGMLSALLACVESIHRQAGRLDSLGRELRSEMAQLRSRVVEIRDGRIGPSGNGSADVSMILLRYIAQKVERGVLFVVRGAELLALGSFGIKSSRETVAVGVMEIRLPWGDSALLRRVVEERVVFSGSAGADPVASALHERTGAPASRELIWLPLIAEGRTVAVIYGDFGPAKGKPVMTDALEILASQAGMAFEVALERRRREPEVDAAAAAREVERCTEPVGR